MYRMRENKQENESERKESECAKVCVQESEKMSGREGGRGKVRKRDGGR